MATTVRNKSTIVTLRLDKTVNTWLEKEAKRKSISKSALVNYSVTFIRKKYGFSSVVTVASAFCWLCDAGDWNTIRIQPGGVGTLSEKSMVSISNDNMSYIRKGIELCGHSDWVSVNNVIYYTLWVLYCSTINDKELLSNMIDLCKSDYI